MKNWTYDRDANVFVHRNGREVDVSLCKTPVQIMWNIGLLINNCGWLTDQDLGEVVRLMFEKM